MKYAYVVIITNKHFGKVEKKSLQINIAVNDLYNTKLFGSNTSSVIWIIHRSVGLKCFFRLLKCLLLSLGFLTFMFHKVV